jgi:hypothetical protein
MIHVIASKMIADYNISQWLKLFLIDSRLLDHCYYEKFS